jgi:choline dehydrogenase-like flavoprotein
VTDGDDDERASVEEAETAGEVMVAAQRLEAAADDLSRGIDDAELGATAGVIAAYRQELQGLANRMSLFADELVDDTDEE